VLASVNSLGPLFCFWDEPESHLSIREVQHFVIALRQSFRSSGQFVMTSHHPDAILSFSDDTTFVLTRRSHLEPTQIQLPDAKTRGPGSLIDALRLGELEQP